MTLKLFDTLVTPILTYGSPVWGPTLVKESSKDFKKICDSAIPEKLNVKLCKYLLGTGKYSVNDAVRGELGSYPILIKNIVTQFEIFSASREAAWLRSSEAITPGCSTMVRNL